MMPSGSPTRTADYQLIPLDEAQILIVICSAADWDKIEQTIQMWDERALTGTPKLEMFPITEGSANVIANTLSNLYRQYEHPVLGRSGVTIQPDGDKLWVYAVQPALEEIGELVKTLDVASATDKVEILPVVNADAAQLQQQVQALFSGRGGPRGGGMSGPLVQAEPLTNSLIVQADRADMEKIKDFVLQMDQQIGAQATEQRFFELRYARAQEVANTVQTIFGQGGGRGPAGRAQVRAMAAGAQVIIEAPKEKFATIEAFIKQLDDPKGKEMKVESIKLPGCDVAQIAQMLNQTMNSIPRPDGLRGAFIPDPATESIIASAPADMYVKINELVSEYRTGTEELALERRFYPITIADASYVADLLSKQLPWQVAQRKGQTLASRINISVDPRQNQVIVNAPRLVHPDAQELIDALDREDTTEIEPVTIELRHAEPNQVAQTINTLYGGGRGAAGQSRLQEVQALVSNGLLIVRAPKARLEDVRKLIDELDSVDKTALQIKTYTLKVLNAVQVAVQVQQYLRSISPTQRTGQLQPGAYGEPATNTLVVIAPADHLPFVDQLVAQFENAERPESTAKTYTLTNTRAEQVAQNIDMMLKAKVAEREGDVRKARVQTAVLPDVGGNRLFVFAPDEYHRLAAELIRMVDEEVETGEIVHIIPLENGDAAQVAQSLGQLIAGKGGAARGGATAVRVTADAGSNSVLLAGLPKDVAEVEQWIQELEGSSTRIPEMQIFQLHYTTTRKVEDTLKGIFGGARTPQDTVTISADEYSGQLIVTANKRKMRQVETFIKELDRAPEEGESDIGYGVYFVDIYRGKASDIEWDLRSLVPPKDKGGPSIESDWFDQYLIVKCRPAEFPKIEKLIRELEGRVKVETVQRLYKPKGDTEGMIAYLLARSEGENVVIEAASERQQAPAIREMVWPEGEEPDIVRIKREKAEREKDEPNRPDDANRPVRRIQQFQTGLPLAKVLLDELEEELTGSPAPAARPAGPQAERTARLATSPGYPPAVRLASLEEEPQARAPMQPPPALPSTRGVAPPAADTPAAAQRDKTRIIRQPDGTFVIQGPRDDVDDITKVLDMFAEDTAAGEVIRIFQFKYGDVSAAAEILSMMFDVQQRQIVIPQPQPQPRGQQRPGDEGRDQPGGLMDQLRGMVGTRQTDRSRTGPTPLRIATDPGHNYLIIKCQETLLPEIRQLLRELDIPPGEVQIKIFQLKNLSADETAENIKDILGISKVQQRRGGATPQRARAGGPQQQQQQQLLEMLQQQLFSVPGVEGGAKVERVEIVPNGVTNSLLVSAPPEVMSLIERVIGELEELEGRDVIGIYYCRLDRARVDDVLPLLQEIFSSAAGSGGGAPRLRGPGGITIGAGGGASPAALGPVTVSADPRTNTIIYTAQAKDVDTVEKHIRALDLEGPLAEAEMYVCQWGDAEAIVSVLEPIFTPGATPGGLRGGRVGGTTGGTSADVRIVAEAATNAILVWGARDQRDLIFEKIEALDRLAQRGIREIPVVHADPERLADILNGAFGGGAAQPGGRRTRGPGATGGAGAAGSGRVTIIGDKAARKLLVRAPDETFRQIQDLAATLDVPSQDMKLRRFQLKFADAEGVVEMVRQALNDYLQLAKTTGAATDFDAFTAVPDTRTNSITVVGSDRTFLFVEQVLAAVDLATPPDQRKEFRIFLLEKADAVTVADAINGYASGSAGAAGAARSGGRRAGGGPTPAGATGGARDLNVFAFADEATNAVMVYGRPEDIDLVEDAVIAQLEDRISDRYQIATLPVQNVPPSQIVSFISMFMGEQATPGGQPGRGRTQAGQAGPQIVPNDNAKTLVVRGTKRQVDEVRDLVERFDDQDIVQQTIKVIEIPYGQDASRLATEVERVVNGSEEEIASRTGRQPRRVVVGADQYTNTLIVAGDPTLFGQAEAIVQQLSEVRSDNYVTRVIELKKLSAQDAEDVINTLQQKTGGSGGRGTSGAGIRRPSGSGSSSPSIRPTSPTPTGGGQRQSGSTPARPPRTPSGGGSAPRRPGGAGASLYDQEERGDEFVLFQPATWVEPIITATPLSPVLGAFLMSDPPDDPPPGEQEAPKARPRRQAPARQPAAQRPGSRPEILRQLEEELADEEPTTQPEAEPLSPIAEGLTGVSGALRGEVAARAVDSQRIVITGDASDVEFIEQILLMMEQTAAPALVEVFTLQKAKATALAPIIEKAIKAQIDARTTKPGPQDKFSINAEARSNSLVVAAAAPLLERIGELVEKLDIVREGMDTDIRMMALEHIRAAEAVALLRPTIEKLNKMREVPTESQASIEADERSNSVLIIGTPSDLEEIQKLLTAVDVELTAEQKQAGFVTADAVVIQLRNGTAEEIAKVLNDMIKAEQEAATQGGGTDRRAGKPFVKKIRLRLADGEELPELNLERPIRLVPEKGTNSLIIFSSKENNEALAAIVDLFDTLPVGVETDVKAFALQHASAEVIAKLIEDTFQDKSYLARPSEGDAKSLQKGVMPPVPPGLAAKGLPYPLAVHHDARSNTVLVIGRKDAVLLAGGLISELDRPSVDLALKSYVIPLKAAQAAPLQDKLKKLLDDRAKALGADKNAARDNAIVYADERSNKLIVLATQDVYDMVEDLVLQLDAAEKYSVVDVRYRALVHADAVKLKNLIEETFKSRADAEKKADKDSTDTLSVLADTRSNSLLLTGTRDYLEEAERLISQLDRQYDGTVLFRARKVRLNSAPNVASLLQEMIDKALAQKDSKLSGSPIHVLADPVSDSLLLAGAREDLEVIDRWVEILDRPSEVGRMTRIIPLQRAVAEDVSKAVSDVFKRQGGAQKGGEIDINVAADKATNSIVVFGPPALLADVESFVKELDATEPTRGTIVRIFPLEQAAADDAGELLNRILELRGGAVGGTGGGGSGSSQQEAAKQVMLIFQRQHPELGLETLKAKRADIVVIADVRTNSLVVTAPPESMPLMESLVAAVDVPPQHAKIRVFRLRNADAAEMVKMLEALFEQKTTTTGGRAGAGGEPERVLTVGEGLGGVGGRQMIAFTTDIRTNSVIAAGTPGYLDLAESMVLELDTLPIEPRDTWVYAPRNITAESLEPSIKSFSEAEQKRLQDIGDEVSIGVKQERQVTVIANKDANRLILDVDPRFKDTVMSVVRELDQPPPQVLIQVLIVEVTMDNSLELGVEFAFQDLQYAKAGVGDTTTFDFVGGTDIGAAGSGLGGFTFTITGADFNFLFRTLQSEGNLNVLSRPQIVAMDNQLASIKIDRKSVV
jgi:type II secretory pathway component GspD/PulD (secretin)